jgi:hypothetical protein
VKTLRQANAIAIDDRSIDLRGWIKSETRMTTLTVVPIEKVGRFETLMYVADHEDQMVTTYK